MLTRLYVDNYKTLLDFEFRPPRLCVLIGENGSGKTGVGSSLVSIAGLLAGETAASAFPRDNLCRWSAKSRQVVELEHQVKRGRFVHRIEVSHDDHRQVRIELERLTVDGRTVYELSKGVVTLSPAEGPPQTFPFDPVRSFIPLADEVTANSTFAGYRRLARTLLVLKPDPMRMSGVSSEDADGLDVTAKNFSGWYRRLLQRYPERIGAYFKQLSTVLPGFQSLVAEDVGPVTKVVTARFLGPSGATSAFVFDELSDGQRQLCLLYALLHDLDEGHVLFLDEPDNFISIREVQPWLSELEGALERYDSQAIIVSHGTEAMDYLDSRQAYVVSRPHGGGTQIRPLDGSDGTKASSWMLFSDANANQPTP
jgi:predicted ATPase